jgi:low affinity Fe/Cu permease
MNRSVKDSIILIQDQQITDISAINVQLRQAVGIEQERVTIERNKRKRWQWLTGGVAVLGAVMYLTKN